ncbi:MAG TPA: hypothetical protein VGS59_04040 [Candidatus Acidoferrales bacterium]|nr:hypothetical protein [Candidatus Acidoferrales bacterium]
MGAPEKREPSMLGLGTLPAKDDPKAWRPSKVSADRLNSLSRARPRVSFRMPRGLRPLITLALLTALLYVIGKLWFEPEMGQLRPELLVIIVVIVLTLVAGGAVAQMRRKRKRGDDQSTLRL